MPNNNPQLLIKKNGNTRINGTYMRITECNKDKEMRHTHQGICDGVYECFLYMSVVKDHFNCVNVYYLLHSVCDYNAGDDVTYW